jgi:hypothetical protein
MEQKQGIQIGNRVRTSRQSRSVPGNIAGTVERKLPVRSRYAYARPGAAMAASLRAVGGVSDAALLRPALLSWLAKTHP